MVENSDRENSPIAEKMLVKMQPVVCFVSAQSSAPKTALSLRFKMWF